MNRIIIHNRLQDIIKFVTKQSEINPTIWYPVDLLSELSNVLNDTTEPTTILYRISMTKYYMMDSFHNYQDRVFAIVMEFCFNFETMIAINDGVQVFLSIPSIESSDAMKSLLNGWGDSFREDGYISEDVNSKFSDKFTMHILQCPGYWKHVFPQYVIRILSSASQLDLQNKLKSEMFT